MDGDMSVPWRVNLVRRGRLATERIFDGAHVAPGGKASATVRHGDVQPASSLPE
jgi:hypothetical protein